VLPLAAVALAAALAAPQGLRVAPAPADDGRHLVITFVGDGAGGATRHAVFRTAQPLAAATRALDPPAWILVKTLDVEPGVTTVVDEVPDPDAAYSYAVRAERAPAGAAAPVEVGPPAFVGPERPRAAWFDARRSFLLVVVLGTLVLLVFFYDRARRAPKAMYVRRIPGIDAMEEAIGRSTEMGRPVLFVPGIEEIQDIQTIAGLLILGHVAEVAARYDTEIRVTCAIPLVMVIAEEIVRQGYQNAGRPEAHRPGNVQFVSSEQFAFTAGVNGIILREQPATCLYFGRFYGESLVLAEAGHVNRSIQIAGTAELTQLPFFIATCDYTIIGEELFAVSAYLSRDPRQLSALKATDAVKAAILVLILAGTALNAAGWLDLASWVTP
jgi:hypothetical protein